MSAPKMPPAFGCMVIGDQHVSFHNTLDTHEVPTGEVDETGNAISKQAMKPGDAESFARSSCADHEQRFGEPARAVTVYFEESLLRAASAELQYFTGDRKVLRPHDVRTPGWKREGLDPRKGNKG